MSFIPMRSLMSVLVSPNVSNFVRNLVRTIDKKTARNLAHTYVRAHDAQCE